MAMKIANVGQLDRILRILSGVILIAVPFFGVIDKTRMLGIGSIVVGAVLILTGFISFCPAYALVGVRTRTKE
ncbi:MAG: DUF2892 domain-containing protein [bacterium]